jgi:hypothetical protein
MEPSADKKLELLHDHYKDTFSLIREREKLRDTHFLIVVALFGVLFLEVQYPSNFQAIFSEFTTSGAKLDLRAIPFAAIMSVTWTLTLLFAMRYCQTSIHIGRQYAYLHQLEDKLSGLFGDEDVFRREGRAYKNNYPLFSSWAHFFYAWLLPLIVITAVTALLTLEWNAPDSLLPLYHKFYDFTTASAVMLSFILYRVLPQLRRYHARRKERGMVKQTVRNKT